MHLSINICNSRGIITFITSRYWINSLGAKKLINRINDELSFIAVIDFGKLKVFDNVAGHHMVHLYTKNNKEEFIYKKVIHDINVIDDVTESENLQIKKLRKSEVFRNNEIIFSIKDSLQSFEKLGDKYFLFQGVVEACDKISSKQFKKNIWKDIQLGDGVFVLSASEIQRLQLTEEEAKLTRPYLYPVNVEAFKIRSENAKTIIYSDRSAKELISSNRNYSKLKRHLDKYSPFITSSNKPYGLHRPRVAEYFDKNKIVFKCMFVENAFAIDYEKHITGMSFVNIVALENNDNFTLEFLLGILNSKFALNWFYNNGKKRGAGVDIGVDKLRTFPLPRLQSKLLESKVETIQNTKLSEGEKCQLLLEIDILVYKLYELTYDEIPANDIKRAIPRAEYDLIEI